MSCTLSGWYWYCDIHDTHGNADSQAEAWYIADAHEDWMALHEIGGEGCDLSVTGIVDQVVIGEFQ